MRHSTWPSARARWRPRRSSWRASSAASPRADTWSGRTSVFPDQLPADFRKGLLDTFPGSGEANIPIDPENWETITDGMAEVTQPGALPHGRRRTPGGHRLCRQDRHRAGDEPRSSGQDQQGPITQSQRLVRGRDARAATRSWWSPCSGRTATRAGSLPASARESSPPTWRSSAAWRTTCSRQRPRDASRSRWAPSGRLRTRPTDGTGRADSTAARGHILCRVERSRRRRIRKEPARKNAQGRQPAPANQPKLELPQPSPAQAAQAEAQ